LRVGQTSNTRGHGVSSELGFAQGVASFQGQLGSVDGTINDCLSFGLSSSNIRNGQSTQIDSGVGELVLFRQLFFSQSFSETERGGNRLCYQAFVLAVLLEVFQRGKASALERGQQVSRRLACPLFGSRFIRLQLGQFVGQVAFGVKRVARAEGFKRTELVVVVQR